MESHKRSTVFLQVLYLAGGKVDCERKEDILVAGSFSITSCHTHVSIRIRRHSTLNHKIVKSRSKLGCEVVFE